LVDDKVDKSESATYLKQTATKLRQWTVQTYRTFRTAEPDQLPQSSRRCAVCLI
jgi:hypothetical protein